MPKSKNNRNGKPRPAAKDENTNFRKNLDKPDDAIVEIIHNVTAKKNKSLTKITLGYKDKTAVIAGTQGLPWDVFMEYFENPPTTANLLAVQCLQLASYFSKNNEEFKELVTGLTAQEVTALMVAWLNVQGTLPELGK